jgi:hypothetical protein
MIWLAFKWQRTWLNCFAEECVHVELVLTHPCKWNGIKGSCQFCDQNEDIKKRTTAYTRNGKQEHLISFFVDKARETQWRDSRHLKRPSHGRWTYLELELHEPEEETMRLFAFLNSKLDKKFNKFFYRNFVFPLDMFQWGAGQNEPENFNFIEHWACSELVVASLIHLDLNRENLDPFKTMPITLWNYLTSPAFSDVIKEVDVLIELPIVPTYTVEE